MKDLEELGLYWMFIKIGSNPWFQFYWNYFKSFFFLLLSNYNGSGGYEVIGGILKDESIALFQEFYALENNRGDTKNNLLLIKINLHSFSAVRET